MDISIVMCIGRLTRDAELKYTQSGKAVAHFTVACNYRKYGAGEYNDEVSFFDVDVWDKQAESLKQYLVKGKQVALHGTIRQERWEQDGQNRSKVVITASTIQLLGGEKPQSNKQPEKQEPQKTQTRYAPAVDDFTDEIPF